ncbi:MAG: sigma-70 family RNA polymerase sigma factor [Gemmatimonadota bacterium]
MDEQNLVDRVRAGDRSAERELYDAHVDRVYRLAFRMTCDPGLAEEFTQDAFVRAYEKLDTFRGDAALSTWLHSVTSSVVLNGLRKLKRHRDRETGMEEARLVAETAKEAEPDLKDRLKTAIDGLALGYRTVFVMHDIEGYTHREIANAMGIRSGTSKAQLSRARARLREALADFAPEWTRESVT